MKVKYYTNIDVKLKDVLIDTRQQEALELLKEQLNETLNVFGHTVELDELNVTVESVHFTADKIEDRVFLYSGTAQFTLSMTLPINQEKPETFSLKESQD